MRILIIFLFVGFTNGIFAQDFEVNDKFIYWSSSKLTWDDFKQKAPRGTSYDAETMSTIDLQMAISQDSVIVAVYCYFEPKASWKKKNKLTDHLLGHEQLHFDITEYWARMLRKDLLETVFTKPETSSKTIQKLFKKIIKKWGQMQDDYDDETDHSRVTTAQTEWEDKIGNLLEESKSYSSPIIRKAIQR